MQKVHFKQIISAPKEKVWQVLWDDTSYRQWTAAFMEGSHAQTDNWKEGTEVKFMGPDGSGMVARIATSRPNEFMSFEHLGEIHKDGTEDRTSDKVKAWAGGKENYTLTEKVGTTELTIDMDMADEYVEMFSKMWPKALDKVKELAEQN